MEQLRRIQDLTREGLNLAGVRIVMDLERQIERLQERLARAQGLLAEAQNRLEAERRKPQARGVLVRLSDVASIFQAVVPHRPQAGQAFSAQPQVGQASPAQPQAGQALRAQPRRLV